MKKLFLLLLLLPFVFVACGDDDPEPKDPADMTAEEYMSEDRPFVWNGDWNDPDDPKNTNPNKDKEYNPLVGTYWKIDYNGGSLVFHFTKDFEFIRYNHQGNRLGSIAAQSPYVINDKMYRFINQDRETHAAYFISKDGKSLYYNNLGAAAGVGSIVEKLDWQTLPRFYPEN